MVLPFIMHNSCINIALLHLPSDLQLCFLYVSQATRFEKNDALIDYLCTCQTNDAPLQLVYINALRWFGWVEIIDVIFKNGEFENGIFFIYFSTRFKKPSILLYLW